MYEATTLAGTGGHYVRMTALRQPSGQWSSTPSAIVTFYGAAVAFGPASLTITNGNYEVSLALGPTDRAQRPDLNAVDALQFSAPIYDVLGRIEGLNGGQRVDVVILPLETYDARNPGSATQNVMHTPRKYHGPGVYPETSTWGRWINSYRREAEERAAARKAER